MFSNINHNNAVTAYNNKTHKEKPETNKVRFIGEEAKQPLMNKRVAEERAARIAARKEKKSTISKEGNELYIKYGVKKVDYKKENPVHFSKGMTANTGEEEYDIEGGDDDWNGGYYEGKASKYMKKEQKNKK